VKKIFLFFKFYLQLTGAFAAAYEEGINGLSVGIVTRTTEAGEQWLHKKFNDH
jgi:hypothetical protein